MTVDVARLRLAAQRLVGPREPTAADAVRWMTAMQAQDYPGALASVMLRTESADAPEGGAPEGDGPDDGEATDHRGVRAALDTGAVVRSWPMRGTLHLVPAEDLGWMLALTSDRLLTGAARRREQLGIDEAMLGRATTLAVEALNGGRSIRRAELMALWERAGLLGVPQRGYHLLWHLSQRGVTCFGPTDGAEQRIVLLDEWVPAPHRPGREEALGEWVLRYFRSHGPATVADFRSWTKLTAADTRTGLALARDRLEAVDVGGVEHLMDPATPQRLADARAEAGGVLLLPGFDELILGYADRTATLDPAHAERVVPGGNGMFRPTVLARGRVVGTWRRVGRGRRIEAEPFTDLPATVRRGIERRAAEYPAVA